MTVSGDPALVTGLRSAAPVLWDVVGIPPDVTGIDFGGRIDPEIAGLLLATVGEDSSRVPAVLSRLAELVQARAGLVRSHIKVLGGVPALLGRLAEAGVRQTVVTGNI
jgi:hypothetical protein